MCEQDGPVEVPLKAKLRTAFASGGQVERAYLVRVDYGDHDYNVALCLRTPTAAADQGVMEEASRTFAAMFRPDVHLDITEEKEEQVRRVCRPFYVRAAVESGTA